MSVSEQTKKLNALIDKALSLTQDGDRVAYTLQDTILINGGEYTNAESVLNVPKDADFIGYSFNVFLEGRIISLTNPLGRTDRTFRPTIFTWENDLSLGGNALSGLDFKLEFRDSVQGNRQNAPIYSLSTFSSKADTSAGYLMSSWIGSLQFPVPYFLPRGESLTVRITPVDNRPDAPLANGDRRQYRLRTVLQGFKLVHSFR